MNSPALDTYLARIDAEARPLVVAIDDAVRKAYPDFDVAIKYRMLMYALHGDWGSWVCAVGATKHSICLRFLYGVLLSDPQKVLRAGTSILKTWDFGYNDAIDPVAVGAYIAEAVARYDEFKATAHARRAAAKPPSRR
jgi:hypothetical protein